MRTLGGPNFVITRRSTILLPGTSREPTLAVQVWADPPTAVCGHPGSYGCGRAASAPEGRRKNVCVPEARRTVTLFSNTPPGGTFGRLGASAQSTVAQPERGWLLEHRRRGRPGSRRLGPRRKRVGGRRRGGTRPTARSTW